MAEQPKTSNRASTTQDTGPETMGAQSEAEFGKQMEADMQKNMQRIMTEYPHVMTKVMAAIQEHAKTAGKPTQPSALIMKILRDELPAKEWAPMFERMEAMRPPAPPVGSEAPDFNLPVLGTEEYVRLGDHRGKHAVALIFGNYT